MVLPLLQLRFFYKSNASSKSHPPLHYPILSFYKFYCIFSRHLGWCNDWLRIDGNHYCGYGPKSFGPFTVSLTTNVWTFSFDSNVDTTGWWKLWYKVV